MKEFSNARTVGVESTNFKNPKLFKLKAQKAFFPNWPAAMDEKIPCCFMPIHGGTEHSSLHRGLLVTPTVSKTYYRIELGKKEGTGTLSCVFQADIPEDGIDGPNDGYNPYDYTKDCSLLDIVNATAEVMASFKEYRVISNNCMHFVNEIMAKLC